MFYRIALSQKAPVGLIVGTVIAGVLGLALIAALVVLFMRRHYRIKHVAPSEEFKTDLLREPDVFTVIPFTARRPAPPMPYGDVESHPFHSPFAKAHLRLDPRARHTSSGYVVEVYLLYVR